MTACQRWAVGRRQAWVRPEGGYFEPGGYGVDRVTSTTAKAFVTGHHYSGTFPADRLNYGLFDLAAASPALVGVATLSVPTSKPVLTGMFPGLEPYEESLELGRFVLEEQVRFNGETWFLTEAFRLAAHDGVRGVVSFSDPMPRRTADGQLIMPGHVGLIYQAKNAVYTGRSSARTRWLLPDGTLFSERARQKIRQQEPGHEYAERQLVALGAQPMRAGEKPAAWLRQALPDAGGRTVRHQGNHRYGFTLGTRSQRRGVQLLGRPAVYPKHRDPEPVWPDVIQDELDLAV